LNKLNKVNHKRHFNNLNSTRFIAFLPVFFTHCFYTNSELIKNNIIYQFVQNHLKIGLLSLDYFFVLSSFLITWIILEEYENIGRFNTLNFYIRRTLRIFPLYFFVVLIGFSISFLGGYYSSLVIKPLPEFYNFLFFILNFYMMDHGFNFLFFLTFFWSVSIEEQFYIFWALIMKFLNKRSYIIAILLIVISIYFRATHLKNNGYLVFHTFSSLGNFGVGSLLAYLFFHKSKFEYYLNYLNKKIKAVFYFIFFVCLYFYNNIFSCDILIVFERLFFAIAFALIIADLAFSKLPTFNLERFKFTNYFGQLSFGLYCYHGLVLTIAIKLANQYNLSSNSVFVFLITPIVVFIATLTLAHLSYKKFEFPLLSWKRNFI